MRKVERQKRGQQLPSFSQRKVLLFMLVFAILHLHVIQMDTTANVKMSELAC